MKTILILALLVYNRAIAAPDGGLALVLEEPAAFTFVSDGPQQALAKVVPVEGQSFDNA
jgi:hypothetical protein